MKNLFILLVGVLITLSGCQISKGSLELTIGETISDKTFLPDFDLEINRYQVHGAGPNGETFDLTVFPGDPVVVESLDFGVWTVDVYGLNADGIMVGEGHGSVQVNTGETSRLRIVVTPLVGTGAIDLEVNWDGSSTQNPSIRSKIIPAIGTNILNPEFTITGGNQGTYLNPAIDTGYHTVIVKLYDNALLTIGAVEMARIIKDQTTYGVFTFEDINEYGGTIQINIQPRPENPVEVSILGGDDYLFPGQSYLLTASAPAETGNVVFVWYVNGEFKKTGSNDDPDFLFEGYPIGVYRVDLTAITANGKRGGSATKTMKVIEGGIISGQVGTYREGMFEPLEGARVGVEPVTVLTDPLGKFRLGELEDVTDITLEVSLEGFLTSYQPANGVVGAETDIGRIALLPMTEGRFSSTEPIDIRSPSGMTMISLPANAYETVDGTPYEGDMLVRYSGLVPSEPGFEESFIGDLSGVRLDGTVVPFVSYGFGGVELFTPDGKTRLQLAEGATVGFAAQAVGEVPPEPIPTWTFDTGQGLWLENGGQAVLENDRLVVDQMALRIRIRIIIIINIDYPLRISG